MHTLDQCILFASNVLHTLNASTNLFLFINYFMRIVRSLNFTRILFYVKDLVTKTTILCDTNENCLYKVTGSILEGDSEAGVCHMGAGLSGGLLFLTTSDKSISLYNQ